MKRISLILFLTFVSLGLGAQSAAQKYLQELNSREPMRSTPWGVLAVRMNGDTIACYNHLVKLVPASNTKLITTGAALHSLGPKFRYETKIGYSGEIKDGVLEGDLYIVGGGDPTTASKYPFSEPKERLFAQWKTFIELAGIKEINGNIIGDSRYFTGQSEHSSWSSEDPGTDYGVGPQGLNFYQSVQTFRAVPGARPGDAVSITPVYPETPWMNYEYPCKTGKPGTGDELYMFNSDIAPFAQVRGTLAVDRGTRSESFSNRFPSLTCAYYFQKFLSESGINTKGYSWASPMVEFAVPQDSLTYIGATQSPRLVDILEQTNHESDNFFAETAFRTMGKVFKGDDSFEASREAEDSVLVSLGVDIKSGFRKLDGSGLSRKDYISPDFFVRFLTAMTKSPVFSDYLHTLPQVGEGTLTVRIPKITAAHGKRVYMKSGSLNGTRCYSGYILSPSGRMEDTIVFSVLTNNNTAPTGTVLQVIDQIISLF